MKRFDLEESVWAKIGLVPTKKDFERTARDYKKAIHAAAKASFDALGFRVALPREAEQPVPQPAEVPAAVTVETTAGTVAEQAGAKSKGKGRNAGRNKATEQPAAGQSQEQPAEITAETTAGAVSEQAAGQQPSTDMKTYHCMPMVYPATKWFVRVKMLLFAVSPPLLYSVAHPDKHLRSKCRHQHNSRFTGRCRIKFTGASGLG